MENYILYEDLEKFADAMEYRQNLKGKHILITGATGLLGGLLIKGLCHLNRRWSLEDHIIIYAIARSQKKVQKVFQDYLSQHEINFYFMDLTLPVNIDSNIDYIIHSAGITVSKDFVERPVETIETTYLSAKHLLDFAYQKKVDSFIYLSTLEIYGFQKKELLTETDYGALDCLKVRSSYPEAKRMAECLCAAYGQEYGVPFCIARLAQTFGPGISEDDNRVFAQFAKSILNKKDIILHTQGTTKRSYCYTLDALKAIMLILLQGKKHEAYNIVNPDTYITIYDMAKLLCQTQLESGSNVIFCPKNEELFGYNPPVKINLDVKKLQGLGWKPEVSLCEMFDRLIKSMQMEQNQSIGEL